MILSCPSCRARYLVASSAIGDEGRTVRCNKCHHQWFQDPEESEEVDLSAIADALEDDDFGAEENVPNVDTVNDIVSQGAEEQEIGFAGQSQQDDDFAEEEKNIPESVKPLPDDDDPLTVNPNLPAFADDVKREGRWGRMAAHALAFILFFTVISYVLLSKDTFIQKWPASAGFYKLVGFDLPLTGEGLIIESASANVIKRQGKEVLIVRGTILNLKSSPVGVPDMIATLKSGDGSHEMVEWRISPDVDILEPDASYKFSAEYKEPSAEFESVNISFAVQL